MTNADKATSGHWSTATGMRIEGGALINGGGLIFNGPNPNDQSKQGTGGGEMTGERERLARELYRRTYPGNVNTPDSERTDESDAAEFDRAYATWDAGNEGFAPGTRCRELADAILAAGFGDVAGVKAAAWDEGFDLGWQACDNMEEGAVNPYRSTDTNGASE